MQSAIIALGGNQTSRIGAPSQIIALALPEIGQQIAALTGKSRLFSTPCFPAGAGPDYVNAVASVETDLDPVEILQRLHAIEVQFDRTREVRWGQRTLDLDLICYGAMVRPDVASFNHWRTLPIEEQSQRAPDELILPHPRMQDRAFVLVPMADIAAEWCHPVLGRTVRQMCDDLGATQTDAVVPLGPASVSSSGPTD